MWDWLPGRGGSRYEQAPKPAEFEGFGWCSPRPHRASFLEEVNKGEGGCIGRHGRDIRHWSRSPNIGGGEDIRGLTHVKQSMNQSSFPDHHFTIDDMVVEKEKVATRLTLTGTPTGEFMGIHTYKQLTAWAIQIDRVVGGKMVESWPTWGALGMM